MPKVDAFVNIRRKHHWVRYKQAHIMSSKVFALRNPWRVIYIIIIIIIIAQGARDTKFPPWGERRGPALRKTTSY